jgi:photosystem II stability/assembly factor-like uncharacterized protein
VDTEDESPRTHRHAVLHFVTYGRVWIHGVGGALRAGRGGRGWQALLTARNRPAILGYRRRELTAFLPHKTVRQVAL